ncbi:hypothetical protein AURDEDRAFT_122316 [Auricularia subglabra TFB-10046 SS5]|nr:hypothetical protein AURDEDRAFT_122316 [Auricularia subglabra TFB-10046 SS5]
MANILLSAFLLAPLASAALNKPTLFKNGLPFADYGDGLERTSTIYRAVGAPDMCVDHALSSHDCEEKDVEAREVTYGDCETPWILCRCANANLSMDELTLKFGLVPPGIRSYVGGLLAVFDPAASAGTSGDFIVFRSNCSTPVFIHESAHSLDQGTNGSDEWRDAIAKSDCVPDDYANTNEAEDFAQVRSLL